MVQLMNIDEELPQHITVLDIMVHALKFEMKWDAMNFVRITFLQKLRKCPLSSYIVF